MASESSFLPWSRPSIGDEEIVEVAKTLRSGWLTHGPRAEEFERALRDALGVQDAFAVSSCTAALHLALLAAGIGDGDEVITPSLTFCAVANAIVQVGARPVFADVDPVTFNLDPAAAEEAITTQTRAIVIMHYGGQPCDLAAFRDLADRRQLILIEDAAQAIQASRDGRRAGAVGDLAAFSFYANKVITTGEGGMIVGRADLVQKARLLGRHGIDSSVWQRHGRKQIADYDVIIPGLKYVMSDIAAAIGLAQFRKLADFTARRAQIAAEYNRRLADLPGLILPVLLDGVQSGWFLYPVLIDSTMNGGITRDQVASLLLTEHQVGTRQHFTPVHTLTAYRGASHRPLPVTEQIAERQLSLPFFSAMTSDDIGKVVDAMHAIWR